MGRSRSRGEGCDLLVLAPTAFRTRRGRMGIGQRGRFPNDPFGGSEPIHAGAGRPGGVPASRRTTTERETLGRRSGFAAKRRIPDCIPKHA